MIVFKELMKVFLFLVSVLSFTQETNTIKYSLVFKDCCSDEIKTYGTIYTDWYIIDNDGSIYTPENNIVYLAKNKQYFLNNEGFGILSQVISITDSIKIDTISSSCVKCIYPNNVFTWNPIQLYCNDTINGIYREHYPNGRIHKIGNFINGRIKDSLNIYYSDGTMKSSTLFIHNDTVYKTFYPNGQISYLYNSRKKNTISFFENGSIKSKKSNSNKKEFNRYSPDNNRFKIKNFKQISYYQNGKINQKLKVKPLFFIDRFRSDDKKRTVQYVWTVYDTIGNRAKELIFYSESILRLYTIDFYNATKKYSNISYF